MALAQEAGAPRLTVGELQPGARSPLIGGFVLHAAGSPGAPKRQAIAGPCRAHRYPRAMIATLKTCLHGVRARTAETHVADRVRGRYLAEPVQPRRRAAARRDQRASRGQAGAELPAAVRRFERGLGGAPAALIPLRV